MSKWAIITLTYIVVMFLFNIIVTIVTAVGGGFDVLNLFKSLKKEIPDETDDGRVTKHAYDKK